MAEGSSVPFQLKPLQTELIYLRNTFSITDTDLVFFRITSVIVRFGMVLHSRQQEALPLMQYGQGHYASSFNSRYGMEGSRRKLERLIAFVVSLTCLAYHTHTRLGFRVLP